MKTKIKFLIFLMLLLFNNSKFQGLEQFEQIISFAELFPKKLSPENGLRLHIKFMPKSILKKRGKQNHYSNKKVTFSDFVEVLP